MSAAFMGLAACIGFWSVLRLLFVARPPVNAEDMTDALTWLAIAAGLATGGLAAKAMGG